MIKTMNNRLYPIDMNKFLENFLLNNKEKAQKQKVHILLKRQLKNRINKQYRNEKRIIQKIKTAHLQNVPFVDDYVSPYQKLRQTIDELCSKNDF